MRHSLTVGSASAQKTKCDGYFFSVGNVSNGERASERASERATDGGLPVAGMSAKNLYLLELLQRQRCVVWHDDALRFV